MCFLIIKINHKTIKYVTVYDIILTVELIKSKLIVVILKKKRKGFRARVLVQFLMRWNSLRSSAAMLIIPRLFTTSKLC